MADSLRIRSNLPIAINATEPVPDQFRNKPGEAPALRSVVVRSGLNNFSGVDAEVYGLWAKANPTFIASSDAVTAGNTVGLVYEIKGDEPDDEYGFQPALDRANQGDNASAAQDGSTVKDPGPVTASDMAQRSDPAAPVTVSPASMPIGPALAPAVPAAPSAKPAAAGGKQG